MSGRGHYGHRLAFSPDGRHLFISSGERQEFTPAQDMSVQRRQDPAAQSRRQRSGRQSVRRASGGVAAQIWTLGHRNPLGIAFAPDGRLWEVEMGPRGGDEMNLIERGRQLRLSDASPTATIMTAATSPTTAPATGSRRRRSGGRRSSRRAT